jgi:hypothetical protein
MITVNVRSNIAEVRARMAVMKDDVINKATVRTLNKVATTIRATASREIRNAGYGLKAATIKNQLTIKRAIRGNLVAMVIASGRPIPLIEYNARQTAKGVSVLVKEGRKIIAHAFIATMPSGHTGVFIRKGKDHRKKVLNGRTLWTGLPIQELFGPGVPKAFGNQVVIDALKKVVADRFPTVLSQEIAFARR